MWVVVVSVSWGQSLLLLFQAVGDNKDELALRLEDTAKRLLAVERTIVSGPKVAEEAMESLKSYVFFPVPKVYHKEHITIQNPWRRDEEIERPCQQISSYTDTGP